MVACCCGRVCSLTVWRRRRRRFGRRWTGRKEVSCGGGRSGRSSGGGSGVLGRVCELAVKDEKKKSGESCLGELVRCWEKEDGRLVSGSVRKGKIGCGWLKEKKRMVPVLKEKTKQSRGWKGVVRLIVRNSPLTCSNDHSDHQNEGLLPAQNLSLP